MLTRAKGAVGDNTNSGGTPTAAEARVGIVGRKGEDLQRKARAAGNAHVIISIEKTPLIINNLQSRHCEVRSNRELYRAACIATLPVGDCFVPRNDVVEMLFSYLIKTSPGPLAFFALLFFSGVVPYSLTVLPCF